MTDNVDRKASSARTAIFPTITNNAVLCITGVQHPDANVVYARAAEMAGMIMQPQSASHSLERFSFTSKQHIHHCFFISYWKSLNDYREWWDAETTQNWWQSLSLAEDAPGYWNETLCCPTSRFQYGGSVDSPAGMSRLGTLVPSDKFGYWGGYRDRIPDSAFDDFRSSLSELPPETLSTSRGSRLKASPPENMVYIREGQDWSLSGAEERAVWTDTMNEVVKTWISVLNLRAEESGTICLNECNEEDVLTGNTLEKQSQIGFMMSLDRIEQAARHWKEHLKVHGSLVKMFREATFVPAMNIWVEMFIVKSDEIEAEYVNCYPGTGLLSRFGSF